MCDQVNTVDVEVATTKRILRCRSSLNPPNRFTINEKFGYFNWQDKLTDDYLASEHDNDDYESWWASQEKRAHVVLKQ